MVATGVAFIMDTFVEYEFFGEERTASQGCGRCCLRDIENRMSMYIDDSEIAALNQKCWKGVRTAFTGYL